jgi:hypothetical protein
MSVSILEALENADYNLNSGLGMVAIENLAKRQLHNAVTLLNKGYELHDEVEPLLEKYGDVENVPAAA